MKSALLGLLPDSTVVGLLHEVSPLHELENLVNEDDRCTPPQHDLPLAPAKWHNAKHILQDRCVQQAEVENHGQGDGVDEDHVLPERQSEERLGRRKCVHGIQHLDHHENGKRDGGSGLGVGIREDVAANRGEQGATAVEVGLERLSVLAAV
jgi:hypothetical protein